MLCPNCNNENHGSGRFCSTCGTYLEQATKPINLNSPLDNQTFSNETTIENESVYVPLDMSQSAVLESSAQQIKFRSNKNTGLIILAICIALVIAIGLSTFLFLPKIKMMIMSPQEYYFQSEVAFFDEQSEKLQGEFSGKEKVAYNQKSEFSFKDVDLSGLGDTAEYKEILEKISISADTNYDPDKKMKKETMSINYEGETLLSVLTKQVNDKIGVSFPEFSDKQMVSVSKWIDAKSSEESFTEMTGLTQKEAKELFQEVIKKVLIDTIPDDNIIKSTEEFNGEKCDVVTFKIDEVVLKKIYIALADELENNEKLVSVITNVYATTQQEGATSALNALNSENVEDSDEIIKGIIEALAENLRIDEQMITTTDSFDYSATYNKKGKIIRRGLKNSEGEGILSNYKANGKDILELEITADGKTVVVKNESTNTKNNITGVITLDFVGVELDAQAIDFKINYDFQKDGNIKGVSVPVGTISMTAKVAEIDSDINMLLVMKKASDTTLETNLTLSVAVEGENLKLALAGLTTISNTPDLSDMDIPAETTLTDEEMQIVGEAIVAKISDKLLSGIDLGNQYDDDYDYESDSDEGTYENDGADGGYSEEDTEATMVALKMNMAILEARKNGKTYEEVAAMSVEDILIAAEIELSDFDTIPVVEFIDIDENGAPVSAAAKPYSRYVETITIVKNGKTGVFPKK